jgi:hypothetical protein
MNTLRATAVCVGLGVSFVPLQAAPQQQCLSLWKTADMDANGALTAAEDKGNYISTAARRGRSLKQPDAISRDEFLQLCAEDAFAASDAPGSSPGPAASKDLGKGDLTPAQHPLSEADARKKLEASGLREIQDLKVSEDSIWRGTALANGQRQDVAIDAQGDIVAKDRVQGSAPTATGHPALEKSAAVGAASADAPRGPAARGGLLVWTFLLIGNALAVVFLSMMTSGGTSAMSSRTDASAFA